jgi:DNA-binding NtrC family response regulator
MKPKQNTILVVDDDVSLANTLKDFLEGQGYSAVSAFSGDEALAAQRDNLGICVALVDLMMPFMDGLTLMEQLHKQDPELAVVIMTGFGTIETAVEAMKRGAEDYITKPFEREAVRRKIGRLMEVFELRSRVEQLEANLQEGRGSFESLVFVSRAMQKVVEKAPHCRGDGSARLGPGRNRHREGKIGARDSRHQRARFGPLRRCELWGLAKRTGGKRALWLSARCFHGGLL